MSLGEIVPFSCEIVRANGCIFPIFTGHGRWGRIHGIGLRRHKSDPHVTGLVRRRRQGQPRFPQPGAFVPASVGPDRPGSVADGPSEN